MKWTFAQHIFKIQYNFLNEKSAKPYGDLCRHGNVADCEYLIFDDDNKMNQHHAESEKKTERENNLIFN